MVKYARVEDIQGEDKFKLISDSQDIEAVVNYLFTTEEIEKWDIMQEVGCIFAEIDSGDYGEVYFCFTSVPWLTAQLMDLRTYFD